MQNQTTADSVRTLKTTSGTGKERAAKYVFLVSALFSILAVVGIFLYILAASIPALRQTGFFSFLFGTTWLPSNEDGKGQYGIFYMIVATLQVTVGSVALGGATGVLTAVFLARFCPQKIKNVVYQLVKLLAGVPSLVFGFFGMQMIVPLLRAISPSDIGEGALASSIILGLMIAPTVVSLSVTALESVDRSYYEGAVALGATHEQAVFRVEVPAAKSGIIAAIVLGAGRSIGEAMAVALIAGNGNQLNLSLFGYIRTLTASIALEMGDATGVHRSALVAIGLTLLLLILLLNTAFYLVRAGAGRGKKIRMHVGAPGSPAAFRRTGRFYTALKYFSIVCAAYIVGLLLWMIGFVFVNGIPNLSFEFLFGESGNAQVTLAPALINTGIIILVTLVIAIPLGVAAAIYLVEYAKPGSKLVKIIRLFTESLSGIPSIVFGMFGMIFFVELLGIGRCNLSGALTMTLIVLPTIIRSTEEALIAVPVSYREGSYALGAGKLRTIFRVILPNALGGIFASVVLTIGRIVGESAALIFTAGNFSYMIFGLTAPACTLSTMMWGFLTQEGNAMPQAYATAAVMMILVVALNIISAVIEKKCKGKNA